MKNTICALKVSNGLAHKGMVWSSLLSVGRLPMAFALNSFTSTCFASIGFALLGSASIGFASGALAANGAASNVRTIDQTFEPLNRSHPKILIFSPHPDDDVLATSGLMKAVQATKGAEVKVVYMTMGDSYGLALKKEIEKGRSKTFAELGERRHTEALAALNAVGLQPNQSLFLGFPDQSLMPLFSLPHHSPVLYKSPALMSSKVIYSFANHFGQTFTRDNLINDLRTIIKDFQPTAVFTPTLTDGHPDHRGTREFVTEVLNSLKTKIPHYEYLIHWELIEDGWPQSSDEWKTPQNHIPPDLTLSLVDYTWTPDEKKKVISFHESQTAVDGPYLLNFAKKTEVFWKSRSAMSDYLK